MIFKLVLILIPSFVLANLHQAPPAFKYGKGKAVFVDFTEASYHLTYDHKGKEAHATTTIYFNMPQEGYPIFDSVTDPESVILNGEFVSQELVPTPEDASKVRVVKKVIPAGKHSLRVKTPITNGTIYKRRGVSSGFFIKDLTDRMFLEKYVPTNYEYDQYAMTFKVKVLNSKRIHNVFANGEVVKISKDFFEVRFPSYYTASSVFFHLVPRRKFKRLYFSFRSKNGNKIPVVIYSKYRFWNWLYARKTIKVMKELERDYGPYPHPKLVIYGTKLKGGMEYVGATVTSYISLGHELQHMYFAKGILPANGNSGWIDEAVASWRDKGHQIHKEVNYHHFNLGNHSIYARKTDKHSYEKGRSFIAHLDYILREKTSTNMKAFLKYYFEKRKFTTITTQDFINDLQEFTGLNLKDKFDRYIFGRMAQKSSNSRSPAVEPKNPHHGHMTEAQLQSLL